MVIVDTLLDKEGESPDDGSREADPPEGCDWFGDDWCDTLRGECGSECDDDHSNKARVHNDTSTALVPVIHDGVDDEEHGRGDETRVGGVGMDRFNEVHHDHYLL